MFRIVFLVLVIFVQACAFTDATLPVHHDSAVNIIGPISELENLKFTSLKIEDSRLDKQRIGWKKNGFGQHTADITTELPVQRIIENAIADAIDDNGHAISEGGPILITGSVERFWFEVDANFWTVDFIGDIQCTLYFVDSISNAIIYSSVYAGTYKKTAGGGLEKTWTEVMGHAVDNLIEEIIFDEELSEALEKHNK